MDVTDEESARSAVRAVVEKAGRIDVLVNNAGAGLAGAVEETSIEEAVAQFHVNLFGVLRMCRAVLPSMRAQGRGLIINIGSLAGTIALPFQAFYCASKSALHAVTEALRMEVRPFNIHVTILDPGDTKTSFPARRRVSAQSDAASPYRTHLSRTLHVIESSERVGMPPERVARVVGRIIRARAPRPRYIVAKPGQRLAMLGRWLLPAALCERLLRTHLARRTGEMTGGGQ
jgi:short-subunit dehydrogenase